MATQPQTMEEVVASVREARNPNLITTPIRRGLDGSISSSAQRAWTNMVTQLAVPFDPATRRPGDTVTIRPVDASLITVHSPEFERLQHLLYNLARRTR